ncbi:hypothetical protein PoB_000162900 [Plakobranchus ocellatus]|uniref:Secreted protein n=1 Tax=Plakobranchus ocellatus TaxID=259542 RepID=A0AAV3XYV9_9GAST|nr:hypothetical protein PoB_000162900 [Plakobranchus ocellatus]
MSLTCCLSAPLQLSAMAPALGDQTNGLLPPHIAFHPYGAISQQGDLRVPRPSVRPGHRWRDLNLRRNGPCRSQNGFAIS